MSIFDKIRGMKKVKLFALTKRSEPDIFLCIALSKDEIIEYAHALLRFSHLSHFQAWCSLRNYNVKAANSWKEYYAQCIPNAEKSEYIITNISYKLKDVVAIMRMFGGCTPIGCSFETSVEYEHAKSKKELIECQIEFEKFWREHHQEEIKETTNGIEQG